MSDTTPIHTNEHAARYRRMEWSSEESENAVVPCPVCEGLHLEIVRDWPKFDEGGDVSVVMKCNDCGNAPIHLSIEQQPGFVKLVTD